MSTMTQKLSLLFSFLLLASMAILGGSISSKILDDQKSSAIHVLEDAMSGSSFFLFPPPPVVVSVRVNSASDDVEQNLSSGAVSMGSSDLELAVDGSASQLVGMRFNGITVPAGATITNAYVEFETDATDSGVCNLTIYGEDADNAAAFTTVANDVSDRTKTSATQAWSPPDWTTVDEKHQTPDISAIIQEIVDRGGWASGNSMVIMIDGTGTREAESYNGEAAAAPLLVIEYTPGAVATEICNNSIDDDGDGLVDCNDPDCADFDASCPGECLGSNMDFESGFTGWTGVSGVATSSAESHSGTTSAHFTVYDSYIEQSGIAVTAGDNCVFSFWVKGSADVAGDDRKGVLKFYDASGAELGRIDLPIENHTDWTNYLTILTIPQNTVNVTVRFQTRGTNIDTYVDDICLNHTPGLLPAVTCSGGCRPYSDTEGASGFWFRNATDWTSYSIDNDVMLCDNGDGTKTLQFNAVYPVDRGTFPCGMSSGWFVDVTLSNKIDWAAWGGNYDDYGIVNAGCTDYHTDWEYWDITGTITGTGCNAGEVYNVLGNEPGYKIQVGYGANRRFCGFGLGGWVDYDDGTTSGDADIYLSLGKDCYSGFEDCTNSIDDDGDGAADCYDSDCINDTYAARVYSDIGVADEWAAALAPDGQYAEIYNLSDRLTLDLGALVPADSSYILTWRRKSSYADAASAEMVIEESSDNVTWTTNPINPSTTEKTNFINTTVAANVDTRYVRFSQLGSTDDDFDLDAVTIAGCQNNPSCTSGTILYTEDFEANSWSTTGTTASSGSFVNIDPAGTAYQIADGHNPGPGDWNYLVTGDNPGGVDGTDDVDGGVAVATSPTISISSYSELSLWYFFGQRDAGDDSEDYMTIELSLDDGASWTTLVYIGDQTYPAVWTELLANIPGGSDVRIRMTVSDGTTDGDVIEGGIDDITFTCMADPCTVGASTNCTPTASDSDGDGINDSCDLDDDNDGILDTDENACASTLTTNSWTAGSPDPYPVPANIIDGDNMVTISWTNNNSNTHWEYFGNRTFNTTNYWTPNLAGAPSLGFNFSWDDGEDYTHAEVDAGTEIITFIFSSPQVNPVIHVDRIGGHVNYPAGGNYHTNSSIWTLVDPSLSLTKLSGNAPLIVESTRFYRQPYVDLGTTTNPGGEAPTTGAGSIQINGVVQELQFYIAGIGYEADERYGADDGVEIAFQFCQDVDTDGDGISDYLDLDSDGDGCPDAIEGGGSFTDSDLENSGMPGGNSGGGYTGSFSDPIIRNLTCTDVDANGVPNEVTNQSTGQGVGSSQDAVVSNCSEICSNGIDDDGDGLVDSADPDCPNCTTQSISVRVGASSDDAEESLSSNAVALTSSDLELSEDGSTSQIIGMRFNSVNISAGTTITNAYVRFETDETGSAATSLTFYGEDIDDAPTFTSTAGDISGRTKTTASVDWNSIPAWNTTSELHDSPDLTTIVQEIVDRPGWAANNSMAILVEGTGTRWAEAYDGETTGAPLLVIEYDECLPAEICGNSLDDDGDGLIDSADPDCYPCVQAASSICEAIQDFISPNEASNATFRSNWVAAVGEIPDNLYDFEALVSNQDINGVSIGAQGLTLTNLDGGWLATSNDLSGIPPIGTLGALIEAGSGPIGGGSNGDDLAITFSAGANVNYIGFYLFDMQEHSGATQSYLRMVLDNGTQCDMPLDYTEDGCCPEFVGVVAPPNRTIDSLIIIANSGSQYGLDNIEYGSGLVQCFEICNNGVDDDSDNLIDINDPDCSDCSFTNPIPVNFEGIAPPAGISSGTFGSGSYLTTYYEDPAQSWVFYGWGEPTPQWVIFGDSPSGGRAKVLENTNRANEGDRFIFIPTSTTGTRCAGQVKYPMGVSGSGQAIEVGETYCISFHTAALDINDLDGSSTLGAEFSVDFAFEDASDNTIYPAAGDITVSGTVNGSPEGTNVLLTDGVTLFQDYATGLTWTPRQFCFTINNLPAGAVIAKFWLSTKQNVNGGAERGILYDGFDFSCGSCAVASDTILPCSGTTAPTSYDLPDATGGSTWSILYQPSGASATVNGSTGLISSLSVAGDYVVVLGGGTCADTAHIVQQACNVPCLCYDADQEGYADFSALGETDVVGPLTGSFVAPINGHGNMTVDYTLTTNAVTRQQPTTFTSLNTPAYTALGYGASGVGVQPMYVETPAGDTQTVTFTFDAAVGDIDVLIYDVDKTDNVTITATDANNNPIPDLSNWIIRGMGDATLYPTTSTIAPRPDFNPATGIVSSFENVNYNRSFIVLRPNELVKSITFEFTASESGNHIHFDIYGALSDLAAPCGCPEICGNGIDDDGDGLVDGADPDCGGLDPDVCYFISDGVGGEITIDTLYSFNPTTGVVTAIGPTETVQIEAMTIDTLNHIIYASTSDSFGIISPLTGAFTVIADDMGSVDGAVGSQNVNGIDGLTYDATNNIIWASERKSGQGGDPYLPDDLLLQIDPATGLPIQDAFGAGIDYLVIATPEHDIDDIALAADGTLYAISNIGGTGTQMLGIIDKANGIWTPIADHGIHDVEALAFTSNGQLVATTGDDGSYKNNFYSIDAATAISTFINNLFPAFDVEACECINGNFSNLQAGSKVWADLDSDGLQDSSEPGVENVTVNLLDGSGNPVLNGLGNPRTTTTDTYGEYNFDRLSAGNYMIEFVLPSGTSFTTADVGGDETIDSDANTGTGRSAVITLVGSVNNLSVDAGLLNVTVAVRDCDDAGQLFVADEGAGHIVRIDQNTGSIIDTFITHGLVQPMGMAVGPDDLLYVSDEATHEIRRYHLETGVLFDVLATGLSYPNGLIFDTNGDLLVNNRSNDEILKIDVSNGNVSTFIASGSGGLDSNNGGIEFGSDGNLYVTSRNTNQVLRFNGVTGVFIDTFVTASSGMLNNPMDLTFGSDGNLYVANKGTDGVNRFNGTTGAFMDAFVSFQSGGLNGPDYLSFGVDGHLYVSGNDTPEGIYRYDGSTGAFMDIFTSGGLNEPEGLLFAPVSDCPEICDNGLDDDGDGLIDCDDVDCLAGPDCGGSCEGTNAGFESGFTGWSNPDGNSTTADAYAGVAAADISDNTEITQLITGIEPDSTYFLSFWAKPSGGITTLWASAVQQDAGGNDIGESYLNPVASADWQLYTMTFTATTNTDRVLLKFSGYGTGISYKLDEVCLKKIPGYLPPVTCTGCKIYSSYEDSGSNVGLNYDPGWATFQVDSDMTLCNNADGTITIQGNIVNPSLSGGATNCGFTDAWFLEVTLTDRQTWAEFGGSYDVGGCDNHNDWDYWDATGTLTGTGCNSGKVFPITGNAPGYRVQAGYGASDYSCDFAISGWLEYVDNGVTHAMDIYLEVDSVCYNQAMCNPSNEGACGNNLLINSTSDEGGFTANSTYAGSPAQSTSYSNSIPADWRIDYGYLVDVSTTGGSVDGSCRLTVLTNDSGNPSWGQCISQWDTTEPGRKNFNLSASQCYTMCLQVVPFSEDNPMDAVTMSLDVDGLANPSVIVWDNTSGGTVVTDANTSSVEFVLTPSFAPKDTTGADYTNATQVVDWSTLDWQQVCVEFHSTAAVFPEINFSINNWQTSALVMDNMVFGTCCLVEICDNGLDDDGDTYIDYEDPDCFSCPSGLLTNPDFESGSTGWNISANTNVGLDAAYGTNVAHASGGTGGVFQNVAANPGEVYELNANASIAGLDVTTIGLRFLDAGLTDLGTTSATISSTDYETYTVTATAPANTAWVQTFGWKDVGPGEALWDAFCLELFESPEICDNGIDDDGDGQTDCADADCGPPTLNFITPVGVTNCPGQDNGQITISASGSNLEYSIDNGSSFQSSNIFPGLSAGSYNIQVRNSVTGCVENYAGNPYVLAASGCSEVCANGVDDDGDGLIDNADPDCANSCALTNPFPGFPIDFLNDNTGWLDYDLGGDMVIEDNGDGTKTITGSITNGTPVDFGSGINGSSCGADDGWTVSLTLSDMMDWTTFQAAGGSANVHANCNAQIAGLEYWDVVGTLTGTGCNAGRTLNITGPEAPYRLQIGFGGNNGDNTCAFSMSTWFSINEGGTPMKADIYAFLDETCYYPPEICDNGIDEDGDGLIDCADPDCLNGLTVTASTSATDICAGVNANLSATGSGGNGGLTFMWDNGLGAGANHTVSPASTTTYTVTVSDGTCTATDQVTINVIPSIPAQPGSITGTSSPCQGSSQAYSIGAVANATTYNWTVPSGWVITAGQGTASITVTTNANGGNVCVNAGNICGTSGSECLAITPTDVPLQPSAITGNNPTCENAAQTYSISAVIGATSYTWTVPAGWTINSGQGTTSITVTTNTSAGDICVTADNTCGASTSECLTVSTTTPPSATPCPIGVPTEPSVTSASQSSVTATTRNCGDNTNWSNTGNIATSNDSRATITLGKNDAGDCLDVQNLGLSIPNGSTIQGIEVSVEGYYGGSYTISDNNVQLLDASGNTVGNNKANSPSSGSAWGTTESSWTYGGSSDMWGTSFDLNTINDPDFGVSIQLQNGNGGGNNSSTAYIDYVNITVHYIPAASICNDDTMTAIAIAGATSYTWTVDNGGSVATGQGTASATFNFPSTGIYQICVAGENYCGAGSACCRYVEVSICTEICNNGIDDDGDGFIDCADGDCPPPTPSISGTTTICAGSSTTLTASGGSSYVWDNGLGAGVSHTVSSASTTTYTVTATEGNGCTATTQVTVTVNPLPTANAGSDATICAGESTTLTASSGASYIWDNGLGAGASHTVSPAVTTTYTVTVTDANGCTDTDQVTVTVNPLPTANAGSDATICAGESTTLTASGGTSYVWDNGLGAGASHSVSPASTTTYTVTVTAANGCTDTDQVTVTVNPSPTANAGSDVNICTGASTTLTASGGTSYNWDNGLGAGASHTVSPLATTTYTVTVTAANGCTDTDQVTVTVNPPPTANAGADVSICAGTSTTLTASGGTSYAWDNGLGAGVSHSVSPVSTTTYTVTVTAANGCTDTDQVTVTVNLSPTANAGADVSICAGTSTTLTASGGTGYVWDNGLGAGVSQTVSPAITTTYTVTVTAANGCTDTDQVTVTVNAAPTANAGSDFSICTGASTTLTASGGISYNWDNGLGAGASHTVSPASTTTYTVTVTAANGCTDTDQVTVTVNPSPTANAGADVSICAGTSTTLTASGGTGYAWDNGLGAGASHTVSPASTTTYTVTVTAANGCTDTDQMTVTVNACAEICDNGIDDDGDGLTDCSDPDCNVPTLNFITPVGATNCPGQDNGQISVSASGSNLEYSIDGGTTYQSSNIFNGLSAGNYNVRVRNSVTGCYQDYASNPVVLAASGCAEICDNGIDDDSDGFIDCLDPDCGGIGTPGMFIVSNTNDSGAGSFRQAILDANANAGLDTIIFNIPHADTLVGGYWSIAPTSALPNVTDPAFIDGINGSCGAICPGILKVEIDGTNAGSNRNGLTLAAGSDGSTVSGLVINNFTRHGIYVLSDNNYIHCNFIGTDINGTAISANDQQGISIENADGTTVGNASGGGNVISGNWGMGVYVYNAANTTIYGNKIGTDVNGVLDLGNGIEGIYAESSTNVVIGGTSIGEGNLISGNASHGIWYTFSSTGTVRGNLIGTDVTGTISIPNNVGVYVSDNSVVQVGGTNANARNIISGNSSTGIRFQAISVSGNIVLGNYIGVDINGTTGLGNGSDGIGLDGASDVIIGGSAAGSTNVISANTGWGIHAYYSVNSHDIIIRGNYIGTDVSGTGALGNGSGGINLNSGSSNKIGGIGANEGNVIAFNNGIGIYVAKEDFHSILSNSIHSNNGLGIDIDPVGVNPNDPLDTDSDANDQLNFPLVDTAYISSGLNIDFYLDVPVGDYRIEVFNNPTTGGDPSGHGEGEVFVGSFNIYHPGGGDVNFIQNIAAPLATVSPGDTITLTATECTDGTCTTFGNTSEFSGVYGIPIREICDNGIDDDNDGLVDCDDPDCANSFTVTTNATSSTICQGNSTTISASASGGTGPYAYVWDNGLGVGISHNINPTTTTTYTVTVTSTPGCTSTAQVTITVNVCVEDCTDGIDNDGDGLIDCDDPDCGLSLTATPLDASCGNNDGQVSITASGGSGNYEYSDNNIIWQAGNTFIGLAPATYTLYARNDDGTCTTSVDATVSDACEDCTDGVDNDGDGLIDCADPDCGPIVSAGPNISICPGGSANLTVSASGGTLPYTFTWDNGLGGGDSHSVSPAATTTYSVTVSSPSGCTGTSQITVTVTNCPEDCTDGIDNDGDGLVDCDDPDCQAVGMPVAVDDVFNSCPGVTYSGLVSLNDGNLQLPVFTIIVPPSKGTVIINNIGAFSFTPSSSECGTDQFTYEVCNQTTGCCATAVATINLGDADPPLLQNVPADITISCDDEIPIPPIVFGLDACPGIYIDFIETDNFGSAGDCSTYNITRTWTAIDQCGNLASQSQVITVVDNVKPELFRVHTLPNGKKLVAGVAQNTSHLWKYVKFPIHFDSPPLVFAQLTSDNDGAAVVLQTRYISTSGFEVRLREEEAADNLHGGESVSWVAVEPGVLDSSVKLAANVLPTVNHTNQPLMYTTTFSTEPVFIATVQGMVNADPVSIRTQSETVNGIQLSLQEEQSADGETSHPNEKVAYMALTANAELYCTDGLFMGETGTLNAGSAWVTVNLSHTYNKPVVVFGGLAKSESEAATIRVRNVTQNSFEVRVEEWDYLDGNHALEALGYMVVEGGIPNEGGFFCSENSSLLQPGLNLIAIDNCDGQVAFDYSENQTMLPSGLQTIRSWTALDDCGNVNLTTRYDTCRVAAVQIKAILDGAIPFNNSSDLMRDELRSNHYIPESEPYSNLAGFVHKGTGGNETINSQSLLYVDGPHAVADWLFVECRDPNDAGTVLSTCSVLLRRDGSVTTAEDGDVIYFWNLPEGNYYVSVRHRNHLALMTDHVWHLCSDNPPLVNMADSLTAVMGDVLSGKYKEGKRAMWGGDFNGDGQVIYQGPYNDIFFLFSRVLSNSENTEHLANYIAYGYLREDFNLDGKAIFQGPGNDRAPVLYYTVLSYEGNEGVLSNYIVHQLLP